MEVVQVAQRVEDLERAGIFYAMLTGTQPTGRFEPPGLLFFDLGGVRLLLERGAPSAMLYLRVASVRERLEELRGAGVAVESEPQILFRHTDDSLGPPGTDEWHAAVRDSEGNLVCLVSHEPTAG